MSEKIDRIGSGSGDAESRKDTAKALREIADKVEIHASAPESLFVHINWKDGTTTSAEFHQTRANIFRMIGALQHKVFEYCGQTK
jgi:hypothetical protein